MKENEKLSLVDLGKKLLEASRKGQDEEVQSLMQSGAPFTTDWLGTSSLHLAAQHGHTKTAEVLLRAGVSRDARTKVDRTPLHMAAQNGHLAIVELLITSGACVNNRDMLNMTPLHWACEYNNGDIVKALLEAGAQTGIISKFGKTPLDIARQKCSEAVVTLLNLTSEQGEGSDGKASGSGVTLNKRPVERLNITASSAKKRQRTKKFPMTAGSWTGNDGPSANGGKARRRATGPDPVAINSTVTNGRRMSAPTQYPNAGSPSLRSPTENSIASLVSAAELVKSKSEVSTHEKAATTAQDASVLDTLATLATATLSHNTGPTASTSAQQVTTVTGRMSNVTPLSLPPNTPSSALSGLTTPLTPSSLFQMPSPLAALSALSTQTSPLPNIAMSPLAFPMPINIGGQQVMMTGTQLVSSLAQQGTVPTSSVASTTDSSSSTTLASSDAIVASEAGGIVAGVGQQASLAQAMLPQQFLTYAGGLGQGQFPQGTILTQLPHGMLVDYSSVAAGRDATGPLRSEGESSKAQESGEAKSEETAPQASQEMLVTLQVPQGVQGLPQQVLTEHGLTIQPVQLIQQHTAASTQEQAVLTQGQQTIATSQSEAAPDQTTPGSAASQVVQVQLPAGLTAGQLFQIPTSGEQMAQLQQNLIISQSPSGVPQVVLSPQKIHLPPGSPVQHASTQVTPATQGTQVRLAQPQQQQQISQQLLQQSIPQGLFQQNYVTQVPIAATGLELQQPQLQNAIPQQLIFQVHEDYRKLLEHKQAEEERSRKELEEKLLNLERDSNKYKSELERAQKTAESYKDRLEAEAKERARLHMLYESPKKEEQDVKEPFTGTGGGSQGKSDAQ